MISVIVDKCEQCGARRILHRGLCKRCNKERIQ